MRGKARGSLGKATWRPKAQMGSSCCCLWFLIIKFAWLRRWRRAIRPLKISNRGTTQKTAGKAANNVTRFVLLGLLAGGQKSVRRSSGKRMNPLSENFGFCWFTRYTFCAGQPKSRNDCDKLMRGAQYARTSRICEERLDRGRRECPRFRFDIYHPHGNREAL